LSFRRRHTEHPKGFSGILGLYINNASVAGATNRYQLQCVAQILPVGVRCIRPARRVTG
jgi:hypothetical protein